MAAMAKVAALCGCAWVGLALVAAVPTRPLGNDLVAPSEVMEWEDFKALYGREYDDEEEVQRRKNFARTVEIIRRNNAEADASADPNHVRLAVNDFSDMSKEEFSALNTYQMSNISAGNVTILPPVDAGATIDWRTKGAVTPVKNQYRCGGCWSFASVAVIEAAYKIATGVLRSLSEQQLLDCSNQGGCLGGTTPGGLGYVIGNHGIDQESEYTWTEGSAPNPCVDRPTPYVATPRTMRRHLRRKTIAWMLARPPKFPCWKAAEANHAATVTTQTQVKIGDESQMAAALMKNPLATAVYADSDIFQSYRSGIIPAGKGCRPHNTAPNHAVTIVGMTATSWIVKNSWGAGWGNKGYVEIARGTTGPGVCGIALQNVYPTAPHGKPFPIPPKPKGPRPKPKPPPPPPGPIPASSPYTTITSGTCASHGYKVVAQDECRDKAAQAIHHPWGGSFGCNSGCPGGCVVDTISCASCVAFYVPGDPHAGCAGDIQCVCRKK